LVRKKGSDGLVKVSVSTKELSDNVNHGIAGFDFKTIENQVVEFKAGETEQQIEIPILAFEKTDTKRRVMERNIRNMDIKKRQEVLTSINPDFPARNDDIQKSVSTFVSNLKLNFIGTKLVARKH